MISEGGELRRLLWEKPDGYVPFKEKVATARSLGWTPPEEWTNDEPDPETRNRVLGMPPAVPEIGEPINHVENSPHNAGWYPVVMVTFHLTGGATYAEQVQTGAWCKEQLLNPEGEGEHVDGWSMAALAQALEDIQDDEEDEAQGGVWAAPDDILEEYHPEAGDGMYEMNHGRDREGRDVD